MSYLYSIHMQHPELIIRLVLSCTVDIDAGFKAQIVYLWNFSITGEKKQKKNHAGKETCASSILRSTHTVLKVL